MVTISDAGGERRLKDVDSREADLCAVGNACNTVCVSWGWHAVGRARGQGEASIGIDEMQLVEDILDRDRRGVLRFDMMELPFRLEACLELVEIDQALSHDTCIAEGIVS